MKGSVRVRTTWALALTAILVAAACGGTAPAASPAASAPAAAATAAATGGSAAPTSPPTVNIRVGLLSPNLVSVIHYIAKKTGAYDKNNIKVEEKLYSSGQSTAGIEDVIRGAIDVYIGAGAEVARANSQAIDTGKTPPLVVVSGGTPGVTTFVLRKDIQAKSLDELKGKPLKIGVSSASSIHLALFRGYLLDETKLTTESLGWQFVNIQAGDMITALKTKQLDGFLHSEPTTSLAVSNDVGWVFMSALKGDMGTKAKIIPVTFTTANKDFATKQPDVLRRYLKALRDANDAYKAMPKADMVAIMSEWSKTESNIVGLGYDRLDPRMSMSDESAKAWWDVIGDGMRRRGEIGDKLKYEQVFDLGFQAK